MKLSKKQKEVVSLMGTKNTYICFMRGLNPWCFLFSDMNYKISLATLFKLIDLKLVEETNITHNSSDYILTELGKQHI